MSTLAVTRKRALQEQLQRERRAVLVVNTKSRHGERVYRRAKDLLIARGVEIEAAYPVRDPARLQEVVGDAIGRGAKFVIVGGGDGTLSSVVDHFANRDAVLGVLPLGTANSFARTMGLPLALEGAVDVIAQARLADIDLARIDRDYFVNTASMGISSAVARATPHWLKKWLGPLAYIIVGLYKLRSERAFHCRIEHDGEVSEYHATQVLIANGRYHGGILVAPRTHVESGDVLIQIVVDPRVRSLWRAWRAISRDKRPDPAIVKTIRLREGRIVTEPEQYVSIDGEVAARTPIGVSVAIEALLVAVPKEFNDRHRSPDGEPVRQHA